MDVKNYRMNQVRNAETQYLGQNLYKDGAELPVGATIPSPIQTTQNKRNAYVKILEQPASKALRFRYECEGRSAGSIPGASSTPEHKTFPSIQVIGYKGRALVVVSCVSKEKPYRPHPHNLVGKDGCTKGVCTAKIEEANDMTITFGNLGVQCVKRKDIKQSLKQREDINVDPFRTGFAHASEISSIDLNAVRLCFQVIVEGDCRGKFNVPLRPVVSDPIYDKKNTSELVICELSQCTASVTGGQKIILLCEKVNKEDISVRFFEECDGTICWEGFGIFQLNNVHKQTAISFRTPEYKNLDIDKPVKTFIQLRRPSDGAHSEALPFQFLPLNSDGNQPASKKPRLAPEPGELLKQLQRKNEGNNLNIHNKENKMNIPPEVPSSNHHHQHATPESLNQDRNEALGQSTFYQGCHMYRYPTPYDITPYHRYHVPAAPYTQSIYPGNPYQWPTTAQLCNDTSNDTKDKHPDIYTNHIQNHQYSSYQQPIDNNRTGLNDDYRYFANRYHQEYIKREAHCQKQTNFNQNQQMENVQKDMSSCYDQSLPIRNEPEKQDVPFFTDNSNDVPKISKLLHEQTLQTQKMTNAKRNNECADGEFKAMPIPVSNGQPTRSDEGNSNFNGSVNMDQLNSHGLAQLNSTDLTGLSGLLEPYCTPEAKPYQKLAEDHANMTDSFSRMSTSEIDDLTVANLNDFNT